MTQTVPADIAAAIEKLIAASQADGAEEGIATMQTLVAARAELRAAILHHLRNADEMKAALERIEQGV